MIILKSKIESTIKKACDKTESDTRKELARAHANEIDDLRRQHEIEMADKMAEIARLNGKIARQENICAEAEKKRLQANELIVAAKSIVNEIGEEVADGFDTFRRLHGLFDRAKNNVARLEDKK